MINCAISGLSDIAFLSHLFPKVIMLSCIIVIFALFLMSFLMPFWILSANRSTLSWSCSKLTRLGLFKKQVAQFPYSIRLLRNVLYKLIIVCGVTLKFFYFRFNSLIYRPFVEFSNSSKWSLRFKLKSKSDPRNLVFSTTSSLWSFIFKLQFLICCLSFQKFMTFVFSGFNLILHTIHHLFSLSRYAYSLLFVIKKSFPAAQIAISPANWDKNINLWFGCGISLTYKINKIGLKRLPWGTP